ncbi:MAG: RidA family protein [Chloroflexi bacterium]|nr:RidA family protein [Chloroflexota bacterium]
MKLTDNPNGNYRFLTGSAPYSSGVVAIPGYEIVHATLGRPLPYRQGFQLIAQHLSAQDRPRQALCAIELRSPKPFTFEGFAEFNRGYQEILVDWDLLVAGQNPVARTNVAPEMYPPDEPVLFAFSYTVPNDHPFTPPTFVVAGAGDVQDSMLSAEAIVRPGETSVEAMREKAAYVMDRMQARLAGLQVTWSDVTCLDVYTVQPLQPFLALTILQATEAAAINGVHWYYSRPPIEGLEFEMDVRGIRREVRL